MAGCARAHVVVSQIRRALQSLKSAFSRRSKAEADERLQSAEAIAMSRATNCCLAPTFALCAGSVTKASVLNAVHNLGECGTQDTLTVST